MTNPDLDDAMWRVDITPALNDGKLPLTLNRRMHWAAHARAVARIKAVTRNAVISLDIPPMPHAHVEMHYRPASNRHRDLDNLIATFKPALDALHQPDTATNHPIPYRPIIPGDDPRYLTWVPPILHPWQRGRPAKLWLIITTQPAINRHVQANTPDELAARRTRHTNA